MEEAKIFENYKKLFKENKLFQSYGELKKMCKSIELTDPKSEYVVTLIKYFFEEHIVLEFKVKNTLNNIVI